ncbi:MAG: phage adaptor protein, partial [Burkholderiaceae bacterium]
MTIANYSQLKTAVADFLNRDDLTSVVPTFISLAEADMQRKVRHWRMETRSTAQLDTQYSAI